MSKKNLNRIRALRPLASRDYRLLFAAVGIEVFGTGMWTIVMVFQVLALDDSPLALSAVATGMSLGLFAFSILGGVVADRFSKYRIIITVQGCTAAAMTGVAVLSLTGSIELWHVGVASFVMGAGSAFSYPAYSAYLPQVLPAEELLAANGLEGTLRPSMGQGLGPALGGITVGMFFPAIGGGYRRSLVHDGVRHHAVPQPTSRADRARARERVGRPPSGGALCGWHAVAALDADLRFLPRTHCSRPYRGALALPHPRPLQGRRSHLRFPLSRIRDRRGD
ncbi:MFS transporter [Changpingibacter yushuensis]|uniref:MFS transporter n=1 Tax=Changpingibacter yushuensis TaxID=2758440 RepID=UPI001C711EDF|nr:MFS transporter [Changpingibacter yushuensis]